METANNYTLWTWDEKKLAKHNKMILITIEGTAVNDSSSLPFNEIDADL